MKKVVVLLFTLFLSLFVSAITFEISLDGARALEQATFYEKVGADLIIFHQDDSKHNNDFYYLNNVYSIRTSERNIRSDILMCKKGISCPLFGEEFNLENNEAIVSDNLYKEINGGSNNPLFLIDNLNGANKELEIKYIEQPVYGVSLDYLSPNLGLIVLGYDESIASIITDSVMFASSGDSLNDLIISKAINVNVLKDGYKKTYYNKNFLLLLINLLIAILVLISLNLFDLPLIKRNIKEGIDFARLIRKFAFPKIIYFLIYSVTFVVWNVMFLYSFHGYYIFGYVNFLFFLILLILLLIDVLFMHLMRRKV